jgi:hypothetical protein
MKEGPFDNSFFKLFLAVLAAILLSAAIIFGIKTKLENSQRDKQEDERIAIMKRRAEELHQRNESMQRSLDQARGESLDDWNRKAKQLEKSRRDRALTASPTP